MIDYPPRSWIIVLSTVTGSVGPRVLLRCLIAAGLGGLAWHLFTNHGFKLPTILHTMIGIALGLLLVFRTNVSFDRWWEGRKLLGGIVNRTRDIARQLAGYVTEPTDQKTVSEIVRLLDAYLSVAIQGLRSESDLSKHGELLTADERKVLEPMKTRAAIVLSWVTQRVDALQKKGSISEIRLLAIDTNLTALVDYYSGCERIARTPVPFAYAQHIKLFVTIFCFTVPFAVVDVLHMYTPIAAAVLAYALFGIDEIGVEIEDPFGYDHNDLPLERVAATIATSTSEITKKNK